MNSKPWSKVQFKYSLATDSSYGLSPKFCEILSKAIRLGYKLWSNLKEYAYSRRYLFIFRPDSEEISFGRPNILNNKIIREQWHRTIARSYNCSRHDKYEGLATINSGVITICLLKDNLFTRHLSTVIFIRQTQHWTTIIFTRIYKCMTYFQIMIIPWDYILTYQCKCWISRLWCFDAPISKFSSI